MRSALHTRIATIARIVLLCCLLCTLTAPPLTAHAQTPDPQPTPTADNSNWPTRIGLLSIAIDAAASRDRTARLTTGGLGLAFGGAMILGGVLLHDECEGATGEDACQAGAWLLGTFGAVFAVGGVIAFAIKGENETAAERFAAIQTAPGVTPQAAAQQGEGILKGMADNARRNRYITAGTLVASGALMFVSALGASYEDDSTTSTADAALTGLLPLALFGGWGIVEFFWPSAVERAWDDYQEQFAPPATSWLHNTYASPTFAIRPDGSTYTGLNLGFVF